MLAIFSAKHLFLTQLAFLLTIGLATTASAENLENSIAAAMDQTANPCQDFYRYACGGWLDKTPIPSEEPEIIRGFDLADNDVLNRLYALLQEAAARYPSKNAEQDQIGALYKSCMSQNDSDQTDISPLNPYFALIDAIHNKADFLRVAGQLQAIDVNHLFTPRILPDFNAVWNYTLQLSPGDPGFPDGDIYTRTDKTSNALRKQGSAYMLDTLVLLGETPKAAQQYVSQILAIEKILSKYHQTYGNTTRIYRGSPYEMSYINHDMPWELFFAGWQQTDIYELYVSPEFLKALGKQLAKTPIPALKAYLRWSVISSYRSYLPSKYFRSISNQVIYKLKGRPAWKICVDQTSSLLGESVGKLLIDTDLTKQMRPITQTMMAQIQAQFERSLPSVSWLDSDALSATTDKITALTEQIGYPSSWSIPTILDLSPTDYLGNVIKLRKYTLQQELAHYENYVDRTSWDFDTNPQTVNAYYYSLKNQIHILGGIMRSPFLDSDSPAPVNYGRIGAVLAHEVMHGFGTFGHFFQPDGSYQETWTKKVSKAFDSRTQCVAKQYASYTAAAKVKINGAKTLEENLADVNGVKLAYHTFIASAASGLPDYTIGNQVLTPVQLFFVSYAQNYCTTSVPGATAYFSSRSWWRYAPPKFRATGPLVNRPEFAAAFNCPAKSPMNPVKKCTVW